MSASFSVKLHNISKQYKLYPSHGAMIKDWSGYNKLKFWKKRPSFPIKKALDNVSISIPKGERIGIIGRNGAGKTTLLKIINSMISPSAGHVEINGEIQSLMRLGGGFHPDLSGSENVKNGLLYNGLRGEALQKAYQEVLDFAELGDYIYQPVQTYSLGMATRLNFAVSTAIAPDILIIDEVLGAGDSYFAEKSVERMKKLTGSGCTLLLVSHSRGQILDFCDTALWLDDGKIREFGDVETITTMYDKELTSDEAAKNSASAPSAALSSDEDIYVSLPNHMKTTHFEQQINKSLVAIYSDISLPKEKLKIAMIDCIGNEGKSNQLATGDCMKLKIKWEATSGFAFKSDHMSCDLLFFDEGGELVAACTEDNLKIGSKLKDGEINVDLSPCPLGYRTYLLAVVLKHEDRVCGLLTEFTIKIIECNDSDPPILHYPALWHMEEQGQPVLGRVSGVQ